MNSPAITKLKTAGWAEFKCNACGDVVKRKLQWKLWAKSYCEKKGKMSRLYRISAPSK